MTDDMPAEETRTVVYLGNRQAIEIVDDPNALPDFPQKIRQPIVGAPQKNCTTLVLPAGITLMEAANDITSPRGVWQAHSDAAAPAWVASTDPALARLLADHWGCELRDPDPNHEPSGADDLVEG